MPTVFRIGPYRFFFYPYDRMNEPPHVHVRRDWDEAKVWLRSPGRDIEAERAGGFSAQELRTLVALVEEHHDRLMEAWNDFGRQYLS